MALLVLTLVGPDRPGLVSSLSKALAGCGGSWLDSEMARLAGQFAGILLVSVPDVQVDALTTELGKLEEGHLRLTVQRADPEATPQAHTMFQLDLIGHDRPGIIRDIARVLAERRVNIEELTTKVTSGAFSAEQMFQAVARLRVPDGVEPAELREMLERMGDEMMVSIAVSDAPAATTNPAAKDASSSS